MKPGTAVTAPSGKRVGQELLLSARALTAAVGCGHLQAPGQVALHREVPVLRVAGAEARIDREGGWAGLSRR